MSVVEVTSFEVTAGSHEAFARAVVNALPLLSRQRGHLGHEFGAAIEQPERFWLLVHWQRLEDHTEGFRCSSDFDSFVNAFRPFLAKPAAVSHFTAA